MDETLKIYIQIEEGLKAKNLSESNLTRLLHRFIPYEIEAEEYAKIGLNSPKEFNAKFVPATLFHFAENLCETKIDYRIGIEIGLAIVNAFKRKKGLPIDIELPDFFRELKENITLLTMIAHQEKSLQSYTSAANYFLDNQFAIEKVFGSDARNIARHFLNNALSKDPSDIEVLCNLGQIHFDKEEFEKADHYYHTALLLHPCNSLKEIIETLEKENILKNRQASDISKQINSLIAKHGIMPALEIIDEKIAEISMAHSGKTPEKSMEEYPLTAIKVYIGKLNSILNQVSDINISNNINLTIAEAYNTLGEDDKETKTLGKIVKNTNNTRFLSLLESRKAITYERLYRKDAAKKSWLRALKYAFDSNSLDNPYLEDNFCIKIYQDKEQLLKEQRLRRFLSEALPGMIPEEYITISLDNNYYTAIKRYKGDTLEEAVKFVETYVKDELIIQEYKRIICSNVVNSIIQMQEPIFLEKEAGNYNLPIYDFKIECATKQIKDNLTSVSEYLANINKVFVHGDMHLSNIINISFGENIPYPSMGSVSFIDFEHSGFANSIYDIVYFLEQYSLNANYELKMNALEQFVDAKNSPGYTLKKAIEEYDYTAAYICILGASIFSRDNMHKKYSGEECNKRVKWYYSNACEAIERITDREQRLKDSLQPLYLSIKEEMRLIMP